MECADQACSCCGSMYSSIVGVEACIAVEQSFHRLLIICAQGKVHQIVMDL